MDPAILKVREVQMRGNTGSWGGKMYVVGDVYRWMVVDVVDSRDVFGLDHPRWDVTVSSLWDDICTVE